MASGGIVGKMLHMGGNGGNNVHWWHHVANGGLSLRTLTECKFSLEDQRDI